MYTHVMVESITSTIQPIYEAVVQTHPTLKATAIHDDITLVGPADDLASAYSTIADLADAIGLQVQPSKCQFIYFHNDTNPYLHLFIHFFLNIIFPFNNHLLS